MKKNRIVFLNKAQNLLFLEYKECGQTDIKKLIIKRRTVFRLETCRHEFCLGYQNANLEIKKGLSGVKDFEEIPSIADSKCKGIKILVHDPEKRVRIICYDSFSVAGLLEQLS